MSRLILYIGNFGEPESDAAGKRVYGNALILESLGYDVLLLGKTDFGFYGKTKKYTDHISFCSFPKHWRGSYSKYIKDVRATLKSMSDKPLCIIRYGTPSVCFFNKKLLKLAHRLSIKIVSDVADWLYADSNNPLFTIVKNFDVYMNNAVYGKRSDGVIAISSYLANYYEKKGKSVVTIPPIVSQYNANTAKNDKICFVYGGFPFRLGQRVKDVHKTKERLDLAVEAFCKVRDRGYSNFAFKIYGITKEQYLMAFPSHKVLLDRADETIEFFGAKPMSDVQKAVSNADFTVVLREVNRATAAGFSTKVAESMSCGTPVVTTRTSDLQDYIKDGENGFFVQIEDMNLLVEQLMNIINADCDKIAAMKKACFEGKQFLPAAFKEKMDNFITVVLEDRPQ